MYEPIETVQKKNTEKAIENEKVQELSTSSTHSPFHSFTGVSGGNNNAIQKKTNNTGLPDNLKSGIENLSGHSMDDVKIHYNSSKPTQLHAHAYTQGTDIHVASGQEKHLAHEAWHVVQQKQGRVKPTLQLKEKVNVNDDDGLEREADIMGAKALQMKGSSPYNIPKLKNHSVANANTVQLVAYAGLTSMDKARVDQTMEKDYSEKALAFEQGMAPLIMTNGTVNGSINTLLAKVKTIIEAWATKTGQTNAQAYEREVGWPPGDGYYGAFEATAANVASIFTHAASTPLRVKLKLIYNTVRNNNLSKWLKVAATELAAEARAQGSARRQHVESMSRKQTYSAGAGRHETSTTRHNLQVQTGFAHQAGFDNLLNTNPELEGIAEREGNRDYHWGFFNNTRVFSHDIYSEAMAWKPETVKANKERRGGMSRGLGIHEQRNVTVGDLGDISNVEAEAALKFGPQQKQNPTSGERDTFKGIAANRMPISQGGEYFEVQLGSESAKAAHEIRARLEAGISGSTDLMMHAGQYLGATSKNQMETLRLALAGWMMANRDHSFYEVFKAAESYGVPFHTDRTDPGEEYENAENLYPMNKANFNAVLPADPPLVTPIFPKKYRSIIWKNHLADSVVSKTHGTVKGTLNTHGVENFEQTTATEHDSAAMERLDVDVAASGLNVGDSELVKRRVVRQIREKPAFVHLANTFGEKRAERLLQKMLKHHFPTADIFDTSILARMKNLGLPDVILDRLNQEQLLIVEMVEHAATALYAANVSQDQAETLEHDLTGKGVNAHDAKLIVGHLLASKRTTGTAPAAYNTAAAKSQRSKELQDIVDMEHTSGTWFSWGNGGYLRAVLHTSLLSRSIDGGSIQGRGLYIANSITGSSIYCPDGGGGRVLIAKLSGVPTLDLDNPSQMNRVNQLADLPGIAEIGVSAAQRTVSKKGFFDHNVRAEFVMKHANNLGWARLTADRGVQKTFDLGQAKPEVRAGWVARLKGEAKTNLALRNQAREIGKIPNNSEAAFETWLN